MIEHLKSLCVLTLLLLLVAYGCIVLYGHLADSGTGAWYSKELDATCITERKYGALAIDCMPGNRLSKERDQ